ncbi:MAG: poly-gamma-glutamate biosynthesis protein PgsC [Candidatus Aminicenantales bacterium]
MYETLLVGVLLSVLYVELMDIYPGGIIVPAYIAFYLDEPSRVAVTLAVAFLSLLTYRLISHFLILFGKRRFVMFILLGAIWAQLLNALLPSLSGEALALRAIGWLIPGLLANNLERQKILPTLASLLVVATMTYALVGVVGWLIR